MSHRRISRRDFLQRGALVSCAVALPAVVPSRVLGTNAPSNKIHLAMMGVGSRGSGVMRGFARYDDAQFVTVCDPFQDRREKARLFLEQKSGKGTVKDTADYREVMARKDIDAIVCCSCDHWHIPLAYAAVMSGKDAYAEKPLGPSLTWAKKLRTAINKNGRIFQYGTQQRSSGSFRRIVELVRNGYLGKLKHIDAWCIDGTRAKDWFDPKSTVPEPVPENIAYDLWLGPAPKKPYNHYRVHREGSFHTYDYSVGFLGGWGSHPLDIAQWGMKADDTSPVEYEGKGKIPDTGGLYSTVYEWDVNCKYAGGVALHFMSHVPAKPVVMKYRKRWSDHGTTFFGTEGWISIDRGGVEASDPKLLEIKLKGNDERLQESRGHDRNYLDSIRSRKPTLNPIESAIRSDTISLLSDVAVRTGRKIRWDPAKEEVIGDEAANSILTRPMREPYAIG